MPSTFWDDHARRLDDPEYARELAVQQARIATVDDIMNTIDAERVAAGMSKAALARAIGSSPAAVRRLLSAPGPNPTLGTLAELAAAVGLQVVLRPLAPAERARITEPLQRAAVQRTVAT